MYKFLPLALLCLAAMSATAENTLPAPAQALAREIFKEMIESKSGFTTGTTTPIAEAVAARLKAAGFPASDIFVGGAIPAKANVVVRYHGSGARKPILLLAHIDVVEALREDWSFDPFVFFEKDGYFYGRGTSDDKAQASVWIANLILMKQEGFKPDRDIIVALTADEEGGGPYNGAEWLLKNKRQLIDAEYCLNEGGRGQLVAGKRVSNEIGVAEKMFTNFRLEVRNKGGHSARPIKDNAIYHLAGALYRLSSFDFPFQLNEVTSAYFRQMAKLEEGEQAAQLIAVSEGNAKAMMVLAAKSPAHNAMLRTTCVATMLEGGHATNALPQLAAANINCRVLPQDNVGNVLSTLKKVVADDQVQVTIKVDEGASPVSPLRPDVMKAVERVADTMWPGVITVPTMAVGGSDGRYLRIGGIPTYGVQGFFIDRDDVRAHGRDERMLAGSYYEGQKFLYELVKTLTSVPPPAR